MQQIRIEPAQLSLGPFGINEDAQGRFTIANQGTSPIDVASIERSRFCSGSLASSRIAPGGKATLIVNCRSDLAGPLREQLTLGTSESPQGTRTLEIRGSVVPTLGFEPAIVLQETDFGEPTSGETELVGKLATEARPSVGLEKDAPVVVSMRPAENGKPPRLRFHCKADRVGEHVGQVTVTTGLPQPATLEVSWGCKVKGTLSVEPTNPFFNLKRSGPWVQYVEVKSSQPGFLVKGARVSSGPFRSTIVPSEFAGQGRIKVEFDAGRYREESRGAHGTLIVSSNDATEPQKEVPLFAFGKMNRATAPRE